MNLLNERDQVSHILSSYCDIESIVELIVGENVHEEDLSRWYSQEFSFSQSSFGLSQGHGGPCGILAVVQAEIIKSLFFNSLIERQNEDMSLLVSSEQQPQLRLAFCKAIWEILWRCRSGNSIYLV